MACLHDIRLGCQAAEYTHFHIKSESNEHKHCYTPSTSVYSNGQKKFACCVYLLRSLKCVCVCVLG